MQTGTIFQNHGEGTASRADRPARQESAVDAATWRRALARGVDFASAWIAAWFVERVALLDWTFGFKMDLLCDQWDETMASWCHACRRAAVDAGAPDWLLPSALNAPAAVEGLVILVLLSALEAGLLAATGRTPGTWIAGLRRRRANGGRMGFWTGFARTLRIVAPPLVLFWAPLFVLPDWAESGSFLLGLVLAALDPCRQIVRLANDRPFSWDVRFRTRVVRAGKNRPAAPESSADACSGLNRRRRPSSPEPS
ncbi:MAG: RDD family protein [Kiritimatiellae bacterium]|nr:RDD family protein [Kiritimatiellia bacterium]